MVILPSRLYLMETQLSGSQSKLLVAWIIVYRNEAVQSAMKTMGFCGPWLRKWDGTDYSLTFAKRSIHAVQVVWLVRDEATSPLNLSCNWATSSGRCLYFESIMHPDKGVHWMEVGRNKIKIEEKQLKPRDKVATFYFYFWDKWAHWDFLNVSHWWCILSTLKANDAAQEGVGYLLCTEQRFLISSIIHNVLQYFQNYWTYLI